jgi:hypothetical protein
MKKTILSILIIFASIGTSYGQSTIAQDFKPVCDSLSRLIQERTSVKGELKTKAIMKRGNYLDFYFTESLGDYPWRKGEAKWFRSTLKSLFPEGYKDYRLGEIYSRRISINRLETPELSYNGHPAESANRRAEFKSGKPLVKRLEGEKFSQGLDGRNIAIWQSHGRYYDQRSERWRWQRPCLFQTCEDMFTQSFVIPYLVPMIENAGGYVLMPRERDTQINEIISDNDVCYKGSDGRIIGRYEENGGWNDAGAGFADTKPFYTGTENPFTLGTARQCECIDSGNRKAASRIIWRADVPERGEYAVYVSYKTLPKSTSSAHYTVHHLGGKTEFVVNQKMGGGIWIYLGTFEFGKDRDGYVELTNRAPKGHHFEKGSIVTADAVRFGGGMGNIARYRKCEDGKEYAMSVSGLPRSAEAARYWLQWAGTDPDVYSQNEEKDDYRDDFMSRGDWVAWLSGGSEMNPRQEGKHIPIDLSLGFHSDAGVTPNDSIVGTLAIYTLKSEGIDRLPSGESRMTSREFADIVQSQIVDDIRAVHDSLWSRRQIWDRSYRESRTPTCPALLLELLSHQNFADMKYGLDPAFRFTVGRAVYKGMLKYLSNRYGIPYTVQPLPVEDISATSAMPSRSGTSKAVIRWREKKDPLEPTADPTGYIIYTRVDNGAFDTGKVITDPHRKDGMLSAEVEIMPGHVYSFRIRAFNDGGKSFPSETVCTGVATDGKSESNVLIVNNFDRVSGPAFFDTPNYAGFDNRLDSGVPYIKDIAFIGEMYQSRRRLDWLSDDNPGFGASFDDKAGIPVAGNTFDYAVLHGNAILKAGYSFGSCSNDAFCNDTTLRVGVWAIDLICGKQVTVTDARGHQKFTVFTPEIQEAIRKHTANGGNVIVSGSYIGTDIWDMVYPIQIDKDFRNQSIDFAEDVLGYKWQGGFAGKNGMVSPYGESSLTDKSVKFCNTQNSVNYCIESPDGIAPASNNSQTVLRYGDSGVSAGIKYQGNGYRTVCLGFPIETLQSKDDIDAILASILTFLADR